MFVNGISVGSILRLCLLDFITVLTVWFNGISVGSILRLCLLDCITVLTVLLSICLLMVSVLALFYDCVY